MADWSLAQTPNFASAALSGYQAGAAIGKQRRLDAALGSVDLERPETIMPVLQADPSTGAALLGASSRMAEYKHELAGKAALTDYLIQRQGLGSQSPTGPTDPESYAPSGDEKAAPSILPGSSAPDSGGDVVVTAPSQGMSLEQARQNLIRADPEQYIKVETSIAGMDKVQRESLDAANNTFGAAVEAAKALPYEQRKAYIATQRAQLIAHGVPAQQIDSFDPTDANVSAVESQVLGVKGILERQDKDRSFALDQAKFGEAQRHNRVDEGQGQQRIGLEGANVGIARAHLAIDQQKAAKVAAGTPGSSSIASPQSAADYAKLPSGSRYRAPDGSIRVKH